MVRRKLIDDTLRDSIRKCGLTRYRLWQMTGVRQEQIARFLNGQNIGILYAAKLADAVGLELRPIREQGK